MYLNLGMIFDPDRNLTGSWSCRRVVPWLAAVVVGCMALFMTGSPALGGGYPDDYPFGQDGDAGHPDGYDGYPGDHPDNPNGPNGGPGGDGYGSGNGGKGGDGGPNGGNGGDGGNGGSNNGNGGNGGNGGDGGSENPNGGDGGDGGDGGGSSGQGGQGGQGGDGVNGGEGGDGGEGGEGGSGNPTCFAAGTSVSLADGGFRNIEKVQIGDLVLARDIATGRTMSARVTKVYHHSENEMTDPLIVINGSLKVTANHRLFVNGNWQAAAQAMIGGELLNSDNSKTDIVSIETILDPVATYNLDVATYHNFFTNGFLVATTKVSLVLE